MPVNQLRRRFHTPQEINTYLADRGSVLTHKVALPKDPIEEARKKVNRLSALVASSRKAFLLDAAKLPKLKAANAAYSLAVEELEALTDFVPLSSQGARKALYQ